MNRASDSIVDITDDDEEVNEDDDDSDHRYDERDMIRCDFIS